MNNQIVLGLIGEMACLEIAISGFPRDFLHWPILDQDAAWKWILGKYNDGTRDLQELIQYAREWSSIYLEIRSVNGSVMGDLNH